MRHRIFGKTLGRTRNQRQALIKGMLKSMFTYGAIETTEAKAKTSLRLVENLTATALKDDLNSRRELFRYLQDQNWVNRVITSLKSSFGDQKSNFVKLTRIKRRLGDDALVVKMAFVKPVVFTVPAKEETKTKTPVKKEAAKKSVKSKKVKKNEA